MEKFSATGSNRNRYWNRHGNWHRHRNGHGNRNGNRDGDCCFND